ncbi:YtxH domain-containing protein [Alkalibacterium sp. f15]|uniref:YtxH domain-containing protein n=1 Tax=Alkalibacterium sp. f15 TaxID=3414029 RepID=UPI003BF87403
MPKVSLSKAVFMSAASAFTALLFAPKRGKEFREDLKDEAIKLKDSGEEKAQELVEDFKTSYIEAEKELESEQAKLDAKQAKLNQTIEEIERDLALSDAERQGTTEAEAVSASQAIYTDHKMGDVKDTTLEPEHDQAIPKDKVDEALHDNALSDDTDFEINESAVENEDDASLKVNPNN